jgi:hypothetical protein
MAVARSIIAAVRVTAADGATTEYEWDPDTWYLVRDDRPHLDLLVRGHALQASLIDSKPGDADDESASTGIKRALQPLPDPAPEGASWQRWDLEVNLARERRLGELSLPLKVPKGTTLRCYVVPTRLLDLADVMSMIEAIETELGLSAAWDLATARPDRAWSRTGTGRPIVPTQLVRLVEEELLAAKLIRRQPFCELGPASRRGLPLAENAIVSHWATKRSRQILEALDYANLQINEVRLHLQEQKARGRHARLRAELEALNGLVTILKGLRSRLAALVSTLEMSTMVTLGPVFQRDHRLRSLLRAFSQPLSQTLSAVEAARSDYPPVFLNGLWELWGAVWIAKQLRRLGFVGSVSTKGTQTFRACHWRFQKGTATVDLDYEPDPVMADHSRLPPAHSRVEPALEWAAKHQQLDPERPFIALEAKSSPDYILRITLPHQKALVVGDACLATAEHHGRGDEKLGAKPHTVEHYRRTVGWSVNGVIVRGHPMGAFVLFPPPASNWTSFEQLPDVRDCAILCPSPRRDRDGIDRLEHLLKVIAPDECWAEPVP